MMNTAKMREKARLYESRLDWHNAALCWQEALALYPTNLAGELYDADKAEIQRHMVSCQNAAKAEIQDFGYSVACIVHEAIKRAKS